MTTILCSICRIFEAVGVMQLYDKHTGATIEGSIGPNVCEPCREAMCEDEELPSN